MVKGDKYSVFVITPAIIDKYLEKEDGASISEFSLMVFDECHHARGNEPYNKVLQHYWRSSRSKPNAALPQVRGFPASAYVMTTASSGDWMELLQGERGWSFM